MFRPSFGKAAALVASSFKSVAPQRPLSFGMSRLVAKAAGVRVPRENFSLAPIRSMSTATAAVPQEKEDTLLNSAEDIIGKYGWWPFFGLTTFIVISKEFPIVFDASALLLINTAFVVGTGWALVGNKVEAAYHQDHADHNAKIEAACDCDVLTWESVIQQRGLPKQMIPFLEKSLSEYNEVAHLVAEAQARKAQNAAYEATTAKLHAIVSKEMDQIRKQRAKLSADVNAFVTEQLTTGPRAAQIQQAYLNQCIADIGVPQQRSLEQDPIFALVIEKMTGKAPVATSQAAPATASKPQTQQPKGGKPSKK